MCVVYVVCTHVNTSHQLLCMIYTARHRNRLQNHRRIIIQLQLGS